jgi:hypothetical protein
LHGLQLGMMSHRMSGFCEIRSARPALPFRWFESDSGKLSALYETQKSLEFTLPTTKSSLADVSAPGSMPSRSRHRALPNSIARCSSIPERQTTQKEIAPQPARFICRVCCAPALPAQCRCRS